jgi:uncharacterized OB-fold protein
VSDAAKENMVIEDFVKLTYSEDLTPNLQRYADALIDGRLVGHKCPSCGRVYIPGKGYCPLCVVATNQEDEVAVADHGTVSGYTIITPVQYYGQKETKPFVYASVLLDGASNPVGGQDIVGIAHADIHTGLRVKAVWKAPDERSVSELSNRGWGSLGGVISAFEPTGEPDASIETYKDHIF